MARKIIIPVVSIILILVLKPIFFSTYENFAALTPVRSWAKNSLRKTLQQSPVRINSKFPIQTQTKLLTINKQVRPFQEWRNLAEDIVNLDSTDQPGLERLYNKSFDLFRTQPSQAEVFFRKSLPEILQSKLEVAFFMISSWIRYNPQPTLVIECLWKLSPDPSKMPNDANHHVITSETRQQKSLAYSLQETRYQIEKNSIWLTEEQKQKFIPELIHHAKTEKSMDITIKSFQLLAALKEDSAIEEALQSRSESDQNLLRVNLN